MGKVGSWGVPIIPVETKDSEIINSSSKGNQLKWKLENKLWVKQDDLGYEGLAETVASKILEHTNARELGYDWAEYGVCKVDDRTNGDVHTGCYSPNFLKKGETIYTVRKIMQGQSNYKSLGKILQRMSTKDKILYVVDMVQKVTGLDNFGVWLTFLIEFDQLILNEDRHYNNIAVIYTGEDFKLMPIFDNGLSLLSDITGDFSVATSGWKNPRKIKSKPFSTKFDVQADACRDLYGRQLRLNITEDDIPDDYLYSLDVYNRWVLDRVTSLLRDQIKQYPFGLDKETNGHDGLGLGWT